MANWIEKRFSNRDSPYEHHFSVLYNLKRGHEGLRLLVQVNHECVERRFAAISGQILGVEKGLERLADTQTNHYVALMKGIEYIDQRLNELNDTLKK